MNQQEIDASRRPAPAASAVLGALLATIFALSSCGSPVIVDSSSADSDSSSPELAETNKSSDAASGGSEDASDGVEPSPILEYLGLPTADEAREATDAEAIDHIKQCMADEGFEWAPPPDTELASTPTAAQSTELAASSTKEAREWTSEHGFGLSTLAFSQAMVGSELVGYDEPVELEPEKDDDPNRDYYMSLSSSERDRYFEVLGANGGCLMQGTDIGLARSTNEQFIAEFSDEMEVLSRRVESSPEMREFEADVVECVAEAGHAIEGVKSAKEAVREELYPLISGVYDVTEARSDGEGEAVSEEEPAERPLSDEEKETLRMIQEQEIEIALAIFDCGGTEDERWKIRGAVRAEYEREFIAEHREELDRLRANS